MYPHGELSRLTLHKAALRRRIARHRAECSEAADQVAKPFEWLDRAWAFWQRMSPLVLLAAVPLGVLAVKRAASPRLKLLASLVKWAPFVFSAVRGVGAAVSSRFDSAEA